MKVTLFKFVLLWIDLLSWLSLVNVESCSLAGGPPETETREETKFRRQLRARGMPELIPENDLPTSTVFNPFGSRPVNAAAAEANKFTIPNKTTASAAPEHTTKFRMKFEEDCESITYYCMKVYDTGTVCARSFNSTYTTFKNYCLLDYVNCMERYELWQVMHMGDCIHLKMLEYYVHYKYENDYWLDQEYIADE